MNTIWKSLVLLCASTSAFAGKLDISTLSDREKQELHQFLNTEIRRDFSTHLQDRIKEASNPFDRILIGEPITPETQAVLLRGIYLAINKQLNAMGLKLDELTFYRKAGSILQYASKLGVFPRALTVGAMARAQTGVGGSIGIQFNFFLDRGQIMMSSYNIYGVQAGFAEQLKLEFYASFCFGACVGGEAAGYYLGIDGYAGAGLGVDIFVEGGIDITDFYDHLKQGKPYSLKDLYQSKAIYMGVGFDVGEGAGFSGNLMYYTHGKDVVLANPGKKLDPKIIQNLKLH